MHNSILKITSGNNSLLATGFVIDKDENGIFVATCGHVISGCKEKILVEGNESKIIENRYDDGLDLAVLYVKNIDKEPLSISNIVGTIDASPEKVQVVGYSKLKGNPKREPINNIRAKYGIELSTPKKKIEIIKLYPNEPISYGYSGSPVICHDSKDVIGIVIIQEGDDKNYAISAKHLIEIYEIKNTKKPQKNNTNHKNDPYVNYIDQEDQQHYKIVINLKRGLDDTDENLRIMVETKGRIDQKFLYQSHQGRKKWEELIHSPQYEVHKKSNEALVEMLGTTYWKALCKSIDIIVDLGVGTAENAPYLINNIFQNTQNTQNKKLKYVVVDSSFYMLEHALTYIPERVRHEPSSKFELTSLKTDFMYLSDSREYFQGRHDKKSVFFMMGGTFCNIREKEFLLSLKQVCNHGDIFIVGVGLKTNQKSDTPYKKNDVLGELLEGPVKRLGYNISKELEIAILRGADQDDFCDLSESSETIIMKVHVTKKVDPIIVAAATRYDLEQLKSFFGDRHFQFKEETFNIEQDFSYLLFEYQEG